MTYIHIAITGLMSISKVFQGFFSSSGLASSILRPSISAQAWGISAHGRKGTLSLRTIPSENTTLALMSILRHSFLNLSDFPKQLLLIGNIRQGSWRNLSAMASTVSMYPLVYQKSITESRLGEVKC